MWNKITSLVIPTHFMLIFVTGQATGQSKKGDPATPRRSAVSETPRPYVSQVWVADQGDGTYKNPVLNADYSDPDVIRVGSEYYLVSSSFEDIPGLPIWSGAKAGIFCVRDGQTNDSGYADFDWFRVTAHKDLQLSSAPTVISNIKSGTLK